MNASNFKVKEITKSQFQVGIKKAKLRDYSDFAEYMRSFRGLRIYDSFGNVVSRHELYLKGLSVQDVQRNTKYVVEKL